MKNIFFLLFAFLLAASCSKEPLSTLRNASRLSNADSTDSLPVDTIPIDTVTNDTIYAVPGEAINSTIGRAKTGSIIKLLDTIYNEVVWINADTADLTIVGPVTFGAGLNISNANNLLLKGFKATNTFKRPSLKISTAFNTTAFNLRLEDFNITNASDSAANTIEMLEKISKPVTLSFCRGVLDVNYVNNSQYIKMIRVTNATAAINPVKISFNRVEIHGFADYLSTAVNFVYNKCLLIQDRNISTAVLKFGEDTGAPKAVVGAINIDSCTVQYNIPNSYCNHMLFLGRGTGSNPIFIRNTTAKQSHRDKGNGFVIKSIGNASNRVFIENCEASCATPFLVKGSSYITISGCTLLSTSLLTENGTAIECSNPRYKDGDLASNYNEVIGCRITSAKRIWQTTTKDGCLLPARESLRTWSVSGNILKAPSYLRDEKLSYSWLSRANFWDQDVGSVYKK